MFVCVFLCVIIDIGFPPPRTSTGAYQPGICTCVCEHTHTCDTHMCVWNSACLFVYIYVYTYISMYIYINIYI